ncbi:LytTR family transcriptional regulator [Tenacibaculum sp. 190130A14a]|uniref:LytTR family transcriptional regulator n=1 Tax=Tenacibaculum polynesiense TaxID=3137857 RepID=A0ABP1F5P9_9FLAO
MKLNPSVEHHTIVAIVLTIWSFLFSILARPFEHGYMDLKIWLKVSTGFGLAIFISYFIISLVQKSVFNKTKKWTLLNEICIYILLYTIYTIITYTFYKSSIIKGIYHFSEFFFNISINVFLILTPIIVIARKYTLKLILHKETNEITIKGTNKLDFLKIKQAELVCISNAQNYVEIFYMENEELKTKLIRSTLKKIQTDFDFLLQIHRSHLINPTHFKSWKDTNTIFVAQLELPVSKSYKNNLLNL